MNDRRLFQASDIYLKMAIGNAPWPIGVDQVGIHMRPSRETISMRYVAHVLNDETQRKFIQGSDLRFFGLTLIFLSHLMSFVT